jgi:hypothetical protein
MRTKRLLLFAVLVSVFSLSAGLAQAQVKVKRDDLTDAEIEIVRDTQQIDQRIGVFVKAIDRRLAVLSGSAVDPAKTGKLPKNGPDWGDLPAGTRAQLFWDIEHILDEAINNIDDIATREPDSKLMMRGAKILGEACLRIMPQLKAFDEKAAEKDEKVPLANALEYAQSVIDSMKKVPANIDEPEPKEKKDKDKKDKSKKPSDGE